MNNEMIERVGKAILKELRPTTSLGQSHPHEIEQGYRMAKAAIKAMREPTDHQRYNYYELSFKLHTFYDGYWERSIDAILKDS